MEIGVAVFQIINETHCLHKNKNIFHLTYAVGQNSSPDYHFNFPQPSASLPSRNPKKEKKKILFIDDSRTKLSSF